jgi:hypothetical protein
MTTNGYILLPTASGKESLLFLIGTLGDEQ